MGMISKDGFASACATAGRLPVGSGSGGIDLHQRCDRGCHGIFNEESMQSRVLGVLWRVCMDVCPHYFHSLFLFNEHGEDIMECVFHTNLKSTGVMMYASFIHVGDVGGFGWLIPVFHQCC